ncbi:uncharacterized protein LOC106640247 [Copidosoma floridanum]|uniref:uncharacterized protein LOC106640247 n=1 Tax=Copidosoma floridanum TaxID=29053 RepID=UPI0006C980AA|nr:uncharacterized protein LOC106640247 [Copidosoma floridanum]
MSFIVPSANWHHISTKLNPADVEPLYSLFRLDFEVATRMDAHACVVVQTNDKVFQKPWFLYQRYLILKKLLTVLAYVLRFVFKCRIKAQMTKLNVLMYPYDQGLLRVGTRLAASLLDDQIKNPLILAQHDYFTNLIIRSIYEVTLHGGIQLTLTTLCLKCRRFQASNLTQQMGDLPAERVRPAPAFSKVGVDYAGPFAIRLSRTRGRGTTAGYIAVIICLSSKALHLEVVEDYTAESFVAAFQQMTAWRGHCSDILSHCGTNFVKAAKKLDLALKNLLKESE